MFVHIEAKLGLKILLDAKVDKNTKLFSGKGFEFRSGTAGDVRSQVIPRILKIYEWTVLKYAPKAESDEGTSNSSVTGGIVNHYTRASNTMKLF